MAEVIFLSADKSASVFVHCSTYDIMIISFSCILLLILAATSTCCCSTVVSNNDVWISLIGRQSLKFTLNVLWRNFCVFVLFGNQVNVLANCVINKCIHTVA